MIQLMSQKEAKSIREVDYTDLRIPAVVIYDSPDDFPGCVVGRVFELFSGLPTDTFIRYQTIEEAEADMKGKAAAVFPREKTDAKAIVCTYLLG